MEVAKGDPADRTSLLLYCFCPLITCISPPVPGPILRLGRLVPCPLFLHSLHRRYLHARCPTAHHPCRYNPLRASHAPGIPRASLLRHNRSRHDHHSACCSRECTIENEDSAPRRWVGRALVLEPGLLCLCHDWNVVDSPWRCLGCNNNHYVHGVLLCYYTVGAI